ncbi:MAG: hypothetical protein R3F62_14585 [Planctomycetota bacterium]
MRRLLLLLALACAVVSADEVHLTDGRVIEGRATWIQGGTQLRVEVRLGAMTFERAEVLKVVETELPREVFARRRKALAADDLAGRVELGRYALEQGLEDAAAEVLVEAASYRLSEAQLQEGVELDAASVAGAKELLESKLDWHQHEGQWLPPEQYYPAIGYVRHKGQWVPKEVADVREQRETEEREARAERADARRERRERDKLLREASERVAKQSKRLARLQAQIAAGKRELAQLEARASDLSLRLDTARDRERISRLAYDTWRVSGQNDGSLQAQRQEQLLLNDLLRYEQQVRQLLDELAQVQARAADLRAQLAEAPQAVAREEQALRQAEAALLALEQGPGSSSSGD